MNQKKNKMSVQYLARLAMLLAVVIIFTVFNIANIPVGPIVATVYQVPVIIGACLLDMKAGAILGGAWGLLNFWLAITGQTTDVVALTAISESPFGYFCVSFLPRLAVGLVAGLLAKVLIKKNSTVSYLVTGALGSLTNTVGYLGLLYLLFKNVLASVYSMDASAVIGMVLSVAGTNGLVEAVVSAILTLAICKAINAIDKR